MMQERIEKLVKSYVGLTDPLLVNSILDLFNEYGLSEKWYDEQVLVIKSKDIEKTKAFLESFGLNFIHEKHGNGPAHYACVSGNKVLEIYPQIVRAL